MRILLLLIAACVVVAFLANPASVAIGKLLAAAIGVAEIMAVLGFITLVVPPRR